MLIEASKGGHIGVVQLLLDYPNWMYQQQQSQEVKWLTLLYSRLKKKTKIIIDEFYARQISELDNIW